MDNTRRVQAGLIAVVCLGITTWVGALAFSGSTPVLAPSSQSHKPADEREAQPSSPDRWHVLDDFRKGLPTLLSTSDKRPGSFNIESLARQLYSVRVGGFPVCSPDEVSAQQYINLSVIAHKLESFSDATQQLNSLLAKPNGISDCQFRVLDGATFIPGVSKG